MLLLIVVFALTVCGHGARLEAPADPASDYPARPDWYLLFLFQLLGYFEGRLEFIGSMVMPGLALLYLAALPLIDRTPGSALRSRLVPLAPAAGLCLALATLTVLSMRSDATDDKFRQARALASARASRAIKLARAGVPPDGPLAMLRRDPETRGPVLFEAHCAGCHHLGELGPAAGKATAPELSGWGTAEWVLSMLDDRDAPRRFGNTPYKGEMPAFVRAPSDPRASKTSRPMPEADRKQIAAFLAGEAAQLGDAQHHAQGARLIARRCTGCHLLRGYADDDESTAPELSGWGSLAWTRALIANPGSPATYRAPAMSPDRKGHMPRFDDKLEPADIALLAEWVRSKARATALSPP